MSKKEWKKTHVIYWSDELNDDFDQIGLSRPPVPENYHYLRKNPVNRFFSAILFYGIAQPILSLILIFMGVKVKGRKNLKPVRKMGCYIYSNHVAYCDAFKIQAFLFPFKRTNIIGYSDSLSMPFVKHLCRALGYLPLPDKKDIHNARKMIESLDYYINRNQNILIFPEAHIWPYYTKIRNFKWGSFAYPTRTQSPVVPIVTTFRKVWYSKKPRQTILIGTPIFPKLGFSEADNKMFLYNATLEQMKKLADSVDQYEYIKYIKKD